MKKDGVIITLTGYWNYGSIMQRFALKKALQQNGLSFDVFDMPFMDDYKEEYSKIINDSKIKNHETKAIFCYILDENIKKKRITKEISKEMNIDGVYPNRPGISPPVEMWLKGFRDSELVITDSFHGVVFSIINNTPFFVFDNKMRGSSRIMDFLASLGLLNRIINENKFEGLDRDNSKEIDWIVVNKKIDKLKKEGLRWLINNIKK